MMVDWPAWDEVAAARRLGSDGSQVLRVLDRSERDGCTFESIGPAPLKTMNQGKWRFAREDLLCLLEREHVEMIEEAALDTVRDVFALRENLINMKKVYLHLFKQSEQYQWQLGQLTTMFFWDGKEWSQYLMDRNLRRTQEEPPNPNIEAYIEASEGIQTAKGLSSALRTAREFTKRICCVPRHILKRSNFPTRNIPYSFGFFYGLREVKASCADLLGEEWNDIELGVYYYEMNGEDFPDVVGGDLIARAELEEFVDKIQQHCGFDDDIRYFVKRVLIARGIAKAIRIRVEARRQQMAWKDAAVLLRKMERIMTAKFKADDFKNFGLLRPILLVKNILLVTEELSEWLGKLQEDPRKQWFNAGDWSSGTVGMVMPESFGIVRGAFQSLQATIDKFKPRLMERLLGRDPKYDTLLKGRVKCARCKGGFGRAFVKNQGMCVFCEAEMREQAKAALASLADGEDKMQLIHCPIQIRCKTSKLNAMCPHSLQCIVCDFWSCEACGVVRCGGEEALSFVQDTQPSILFLDFDRTLATTKSGASPLRVNGSVTHTVEPFLKEAALEIRNSHVVTRNRHKEDIETFLAQNGLGHVKVHSLKLMDDFDSKSQIMESLMGPDDVGVFVDDNYTEVLDPALREWVQREPGKLTSILFTRTA